MLFAVVVEVEADAQASDDSLAPLHVLTEEKERRRA